MACPICEKETDQKYRPFCSARCADIDLGKWISGAYTVPSEDEVDPEQLNAAMEEATRKIH